ncbi:TRAP transporter large permease subunit [Acidilutibacter cellobiosedens]|jgi:H+/gluconate symporter-like permease|uniref:TRAP transporter large permease subunit n=1 Tax=Acidilutibacter cellobiosedens TaxID=2507161 RepID=A0A410QCP4_9FIRM|nr:SLC13 family permease [Acidilutibacter cellobiosedens]MBE6083198.1 TRAP transporter large permease subunit [Tissierellaceae bacterium]QAT61832.1 TRAP transporter large permease subunit [Acidilutibacter cellobiosedens]
MIFNLSPIFGLVPLVIYIILSFKDINPVLNVAISVILTAILTKQPFSSFGGVLAESLGSFLGMIGFIIMLGSGLGAILQKTGVAEYLVKSLMKKIGVNNEKKAILATMISSMVLVSLLGTLAGANAIIAPIIIPLVAVIGITPSTVATIFLGAGLTGMFVGPYTPQVVTIMGLTGLSYGQYILGAGIPLAILVLVITYIFANRIQKKTKGIYAYENVEKVEEDYEAKQETKRATLAFILSMTALIVYGITLQSGASYAILVIVLASVITGLVGKLKPNDLIDTFIKGASRMMWLFIMFILFNPFIEFIDKAGSFKALVSLLKPLLKSQNKVIFSIVTALTGIFGVGGAATADNIVMNNMFKIIVKDLGVSPSLWALILLVSGQITSFAYPEADMIGQMGLARSKDMKNLVKYGITVTVCSVILAAVRAIFD